MAGEKSCKKPYEKEQRKNRYKDLPQVGRLNKGNSTFKVESSADPDDPGKQVPDVPIRRFGDINEKIKYFPLLEINGNLTRKDFGDGLGEVYAYRWKNDKDQGWVSYWAQFENDANITIDKESTVSSNCYLFAKNGTINLTKTQLISTQIWAEGDVTMEKCKIRDCYIFGSVNFQKINIDTRNRFFTQSCNLIECTVTGNNLFYQDHVDYGGTINILKDAKIENHVEIIGNITVNPQASVSGNAKVAGNVTIEVKASVSGNAYINSGSQGSITIDKEAKVEADAIIINNATIGVEAVISGQALIGDNATIGPQVKVNGSACVLDNAQVNPNCTISGNAIVNMNAVLEPNVQVSGKGIATGSTTALPGTQITGNGILCGSGTVKASSIISGTGRVFDGINCPHAVGGKVRHWDERSCKNQIYTLIDERESCISPCGGSCTEYMPPPTIC